MVRCFWWLVVLFRFSVCIQRFAPAVASLQMWGTQRKLSLTAIYCHQYQQSLLKITWNILEKASFNLFRYVSISYPSPPVRLLETIVSTKFDIIPPPQLLCHRLPKIVKTIHVSHWNVAHSLLHPKNLSSRDGSKKCTKARGFLNLFSVCGVRLHSLSSMCHTLE